jgi:DNA-binding NtrC family response regulator
MVTGSVFGDDDPFLHRFLPGPSARMRELRAAIHRANLERNRDLVRTILLTGESGTGKYRAAQVIAGHARWNGGKFRPDDPKPSTEVQTLMAPIESYATRMGDVLLTAIPESLAETELFGNVAGAFTGARTAKPGYFGDPAYDHVLLDEIGDAPLEIQGKLLAVLEGRPFVPVGGSAKDRVVCNKRIMMATLRDLDAAVREQRFREDLLRRVTRWSIRLPALREIPESIPDIARTIFDERCPIALKHQGVELSKEDLEWAQKQYWPGNIRELRDTIEDWLSNGASISLSDVASQRDRMTQGGVSGDADIRSQVRRTIDDILSGRRESPGTIGEFLLLFTRPVEETVKDALYGWYSETGASEDKCRRLFSGNAWSSIKTTMSSFKRAR